MRTSNMFTWLKFSMAFVAVVSVASMLTANDDEKATKVDRAEQKRLSRIWKTQTPVQGFDSVEMFAGMKSGQIEVIIKTKDEKQEKQDSREVKENEKRGVPLIEN